MSRLHHAHHITFSDFAPFVNAWKHTAPEELEGWEKVARSLNVSTAAMLWSLWKIINHQIDERGRTNMLYIEWLFRDIKLLYPYGTLEIPTAELGRAKCGLSYLALTEKNAIE